jgi:hypothetical protein
MEPTSPDPEKGPAVFIKGYDVDFGNMLCKLVFHAFGI